MGTSFFIAQGRIISRPARRCGADVGSFTDQGGFDLIGMRPDSTTAAACSRAKVRYALGKHLDRGPRKVALTLHRITLRDELPPLTIVPGNMRAAPTPAPLHLELHK